MRLTTDPGAYVTPTEDVNNAFDETVSGVSIKLIVGLSVGLGVPFLLGLMGAFW